VKSVAEACTMIKKARIRKMQPKRKIEDRAAESALITKFDTGSLQNTRTARKRDESYTKVHEENLSERCERTWVSRKTVAGGVPKNDAKTLGL